MSDQPGIQLEKFAVEVVRSAWEGFGMDGGEIEDLASKCGMIERVEFDPVIHTDPDNCAEPGDLWWSFTPAFKAILDTMPLDDELADSLSGEPR